MPPDPRFFDLLGPVALDLLAQAGGASLFPQKAADQLISAPASLAGATEGEIAFCADRSRLDELRATRAGACFVPASLASEAPCAVLVSATPAAAWAAAAALLVAARRSAAGGPAVDPAAELEEDVVLGPGVAIGPGAQIGRGSRIGAGAAIGPGVAIGRDCEIGPRAVLGFALLGDRVRIHAGAVIGEPGFGAAAGPRGVVDLPQFGRVILQDGVTVGANSCIDRGALGDTMVGENTKIDNLVQVAHNVSIGRNCVIAAHTGISGSCVVQDGCRLGGRVGLADHITVGAGSQLAAASGVMRDVPAGATWGGLPARPMVRWMRETAWVSRESQRRRGGQP